MLETAATATNNTRRVVIRYPRRHEGQIAVVKSSRRFNWLAAGRRWRKTTLLMSIAVYKAAHGAEIIWGAPTYDQVLIGWQEARKAAGSVAQFVESRREARFPGGGRIIYRSLDNPDNARGHTADGVIIDEAADVAPEAWYEVLLPVLMSTGGWAWIIGTPKGRNWFATEWGKAQSGVDPNAVSWRAPSLGVEVVNGQLVRQPHPLENPELPFTEVETLWRSMPDRAFRQEILAEFIEDAGGVFRGVRPVATRQPEEPREGRCYVIGADWGRTNDYSAFCVLDCTDQPVRQVYLDRSTGVTYAQQAGRLRALMDRYQPLQVIAETNAMGGPVVETLQAEGYPVYALTTTNASKQQQVDALALAFERGDLELLDNDVQTDELESYQGERLPSGLMRYAAPDDGHDDTVMALMLAWSAAKHDYDFGHDDAPETDDAEWTRMMQQYGDTAPKRAHTGWGRLNA